MAPKNRPTTIERARQRLKGGGVVRDDSDDELGIEDFPWEWILADQDAAARRQSENQEAGNNKASRKRKASAISSSGDIVGARMGKFECRLGDTVLLKAESGNEAWVGIICDFFEDEEEDAKMANFMWFSTPREIRNQAKKRSDAMDVRQPPPYSYARKY